MPTTVSITRCRVYDQEQVLAAVRNAVDLIGGIGKFLSPGDQVLIKPNLLKASRADAAVTTHPEIVRAMIRLVREAGAFPSVGDSPGIGDLRRICSRTGLLAVLEQERVPLLALEDPVQIKGNGRFQWFEIARTAVEADAIINLPKLKTHGMTVLTGAVKNLFGCVPGKRKVQWHFRTGVDHGSFMQMLVELSALLEPRLTVMDAIVGMEGNGPGSGDPRTVGAVVAGADPIAVDTISGLMVGITPDTLPVLRAARDAGVGEQRMDHIEVVGEPVTSMLVKDFRFPPREHLEWRLPEWLRRSLKDALTTKPVIDHRACVHCGICGGHCPQRAITDTGRRLVIDHRTCIRCFCCQEFCPQGAITVGKGWALRLTGS